MNYKAYFKSLEGIDYRVEIITDQASTEYKELLLAGEQPVVVDYIEAERLFDPVRKSTCTIKLLADTYPLDIYTGKANGTEVLLYKNDRIEWMGFLQPNIYNQGYVNDIENLEIVADDYLSVLQYFDFKLSGEKPQIVSFLDIIKTNIIPLFPRINEIQMSIGSVYHDGQYDEIFGLHTIYISEGNFFSKEGEPWKLNEVIEEMARFMGASMVQYKDSFLGIDFSYNPTGSITSKSYSRRYDFDPGPVSGFGKTETITKDSYRMTGADMSLDDVFNKVTVRDNFYNLDNVLPDLFADDKLRNLNGDFETMYHRKAWLDNSQHNEQGDCYYRFFDNSDWKQHCYLPDTINVKPNEIYVPDNFRGDTTSMRQYISPAIVDFGMQLYHKRDERIDFKKYLVLCQRNSPILYTDASGFMKYNPVEFVPLIDTTAIAPMIYGDNSWLILSCESCKTFFVERPFLNLDSDTCKKKIDTRWISTANLEGKYYDYKITGIKWVPSLAFKLRIDGKWWNGTGWQADECVFLVKQGELEGSSYFQTNVPIKNNVESSTFVGEIGYRIKMPQTKNTAADIYFAVCQPEPSLILKNKMGDYGEGGNADTWISNLAFKIVKEGQQIWANNDVVYENIIDEGNVIEGPEITCRITSDAGKAFSLSNVGVLMYDGLIEPDFKVEKHAFEGEAHKPEENIVQCYVHQYSTPSIRENVTLDMRYEIADTILDRYWNKRFYVMGMQKDYAMDRQTISLIEKKN